MRIVLAEEMRNLDQRAGTQYGLPGLLLMENAGHAVAEAACSMLGGGRDKKSVISPAKAATVATGPVPDAGLSMAAPGCASS